MTIANSINNTDDSAGGFVSGLFGLIFDLIGWFWSQFLWADDWRMRIGGWLAVWFVTFVVCGVISAVFTQGDDQAEGVVWTFGMGTVFVVGMFAIFIYSP